MWEKGLAADECAAETAGVVADPAGGLAGELPWLLCRLAGELDGELAGLSGRLDWMTGVLD